jgi:transposase
LSPRRREYAKLPGCRHPDAAARWGQGASTQVRRWRRARGPGFQEADGAKGKLTEAQAAELEEVLAREGFLAKPRPDRTPFQ